MVQNINQKRGEMAEVNLESRNLATQQSRNLATQQLNGWSEATANEQ
jgi:ribosome modulation factor